MKHFKKRYAAIFAVGIAAALLSVVAYDNFRAKPSEEECKVIRSLTDDAEAQASKYEREGFIGLADQAREVGAEAKALHEECFRARFSLWN